MGSLSYRLSKPLLFSYTNSHRKVIMIIFVAIPATLCFFPSEILLRNIFKLRPVRVCQGTLRGINSRIRTLSAHGLRFFPWSPWQPSLPASRGRADNGGSLQKGNASPLSHADYTQEGRSTCMVRTFTSSKRSLLLHTVRIHCNLAVQIQVFIYPGKGANMLTSFSMFAIR